jgi:hypothetical protein
VNGTTVTGTSGDGSDCPLCVVEVFLDDTDFVTETLQPLDLVTAGANGQWVAALPAPLQAGQGLRTMSTVPDSFTIIGLDPETTSKLSALQAARYQVTLPMVVKQR